MLDDAAVADVATAVAVAVVVDGVEMDWGA